MLNRHSVHIGYDWKDTYGIRNYCDLPACFFALRDILFSSQLACSTEIRFGNLSEPGDMAKRYYCALNKEW